MNLKTIVVFHYHWLPGGVRSAIEKSLTALNEAGYLNGLNVRLVTGDMHKSKKGGDGAREENKHIDNFRNKFSSANFKLKIKEDICPGGTLGILGGGEAIRTLSIIMPFSWG